MEKNLEVIRNLQESRNALKEYSREIVSNKRALRMAVEQFGCRCMLGGIISDKNPITLHHIVGETDGGKSNVKNSALLSRYKHVMFNALELHFSALSMDINAYLYLFRGDCLDEEIVSRIKRIVSVANEQNRIQELFRTLKSKPTINTLIQQHEEIAFYKNNFPVQLPENLDQYFPILSKHFRNLYGEISTYIQTYGASDCDIEIATRINTILTIAKCEEHLESRALPLYDEKIEILEEIKGELETQKVKKKDVISR